MIFSDTESREVQLTLHAVEDAKPGMKKFDVHSRPYEDREAPWSLNASGTLITEPSGAPVTENRDSLETVLERMTPKRPQLLFDGFAQQELRWGPTWLTSLTAIWSGHKKALGEISVGEELAPHVGDEPIHPVLLDLCCGISGAALM